VGKDKLLVATGNPGKMKEFRALLRGIPVVLVSPEDLVLNVQVREDGETYVENAKKKAVAYARSSSLISLADDSGLEVDALNGAPGVHSRRYVSNAEATDTDRRAFLLSNLRGKPRPWTARFRAAIAIAAPNRETRWAEGECRGEIIPEERGDGGFGYDRIFLVAGTHRTMAELGMDEKNSLSHRAKAISEAMPMLLELLGA
jgi:XTP/dITP diphosphohydrolase